MSIGQPRLSHGQVCWVKRWERVDTMNADTDQEALAVQLATVTMKVGSVESMALEQTQRVG